MKKMITDVWILTLIFSFPYTIFCNIADEIFLLFEETDNHKTNNQTYFFFWFKYV